MRTRRESIRLKDENPKASLLRPQRRRFRGLGAAAHERSEVWHDLGMAVEEENGRESEACIVNSKIWRNGGMEKQRAGEIYEI